MSLWTRLNLPRKNHAQPRMTIRWASFVSRSTRRPNPPTLSRFSRRSSAVGVGSNLRATSPICLKKHRAATVARSASCAWNASFEVTQWFRSITADPASERGPFPMAASGGRVLRSDGACLVRMIAVSGPSEGLIRISGSADSLIKDSVRRNPSAP